MIDKPTHYINESSTCIDLIFSSDVNQKKNCGVEQSLNKKCHHNIIHGTLNFDIPLPPPSYNYGILKVLILSAFKNQSTVLTELRLFKIKIPTKFAKFYRKYY